MGLRAGFRAPDPGTPMCRYEVAARAQGRGRPCVWCGTPGRGYICDRVRITLCRAHGRALARIIEEGR